MKKFIKILLIILATVLSLVVITAIVLPLVFDPNDYKPQITQLVKEQTGRDLQIPGEIELSVFPWLGVKLGKVELSNARGFGKQAFAKIDAVDVRVELLPLLKKQIRVGRVEINGLKLDLQRNAQGQTNWDDLVKKDTTTQPQQKKPAKTSEQPLAIASLAVGGISIHNASASWNDQQNNQHVQIQRLDLESSAIQADEQIKLNLTTEFKSSAPDIKGTLELKTRAMFTQNNNSLSLDDTAIVAHLAGSALPANRLDAELASNKTLFNQNKQSLTVQGLKLAALGAKLHADVEASGLDKEPRYQISLASDPFSGREVARQLGITLPETADPNALSNIQLSSKLVGDLNNVTIKPLTLQLDNSNVDGYLQVKNFSKPAIRYQFTLDAINADRYMAPVKTAPGGKAVAPATAVSSQALQLPTELLRSLDIKGDIKVGELQISNMHSKQLLLNTNAKDGVIRLYPIKASMYKGAYNGDIKLDVRGTTPSLSMNERLSNINIGPMLKDLLGDDKVQGVANLNAKLTARGTTPESIRKTLTGSAGFQFKDGLVKGFNIAAYERALKAKLKGQPEPKETDPAQTDFAEIKGTIKVTNGLASNKDLSAALPHARIIGKGSANLVKETVDYTIYTKFTSKAEGQSGKTYAQMNKTPLPVHFKGKLTQPDISVDYQSVLKAEAKKKVDEKKAEAKSKLEAKRKEKEEAAKKKLEQKINDKLKDLFRR
jgi:AsmA protein